MAWILPAISAGSSIFGGISGANQQNNLYAKAGGFADQEAAGLNHAMGGIDSLLSGINPLISSSQSNAASYNPAINSSISSLLNFNGLSRPQIGQLQGAQTNAVRSGVHSLLSSAGGIANPGRLGDSMMRSVQDSNLQLASNLGAHASDQRLSALGEAGQLSLTAHGQEDQQLMSMLGLSGSLLGEQGQLSTQFGDLARLFMGGGQNLGNPLSSMFQSLGANPLIQGIGQPGGLFGGSAAASGGMDWTSAFQTMGDNYGSSGLMDDPFGGSQIGSIPGLGGGINTSGFMGVNQLPGVLQGPTSRSGGFLASQPNF